MTLTLAEKHKPGQLPVLSQLRRLVRSKCGISMVEFACSAPVFLTMGMFGFEVANMASARMQISQIALSLADNASRLGQTDNSAVTPTVSENDVEAVLKGALRQGQTIGLQAHGRIVLTSLEYDDTTKKQFIHWQRCAGDKTQASAYGNETDKNGLNGPDITGLGSGANKITALSGQAVMFVEIFYDYQNLFAQPFGTTGKFDEQAAFIIRDDRKLNPSDQKGLSGTAKNTC